MRLEDPIITDHDWHYNKLFSLAWNALISINEPLDGQVWSISPVELPCSQPFGILKDHRQLVVLYYLLEHGRVDVPALDGLLVRASTVDVSRPFQRLLEHVGQAVLLVSKDEGSIDPVVLVQVDRDENVGERFVNRHQDYFLVLFE